MRQPALFLVETGLSDRVTLEMGAGERATLGVRALFGQQGRFKLVGGLDGLITDGEAHLAGVEKDVGEGSRLWARTLWSWRFVGASAGLAARLENGSVGWVPSVALKLENARFLPVSIGWDCAYEDDILRQSVGIGMAWRELSLSMGLSEVQSWAKNGGAAPRGAVDGRENPGVWMRAAWEVPASVTGLLHESREEDPDAGLSQVAQIDAALTRRSVRRDLSELALADEDDPGRKALLRRQILSGGMAARDELVRVALSAQYQREERIQAVLTLDAVLAEEDAPFLARLAKDPDSQIRLAAARELLRLDAPVARTALEQLTIDPDGAVRSTASLGAQAPSQPAESAPEPAPAPKSEEKPVEKREAKPAEKAPESHDSKPAEASKSKAAEPTH